MLLWILPGQDSTHDLSNTKQMANKTDTYWKYRSGCSLPLDTCKFDNFSTCIAIVEKLAFLYLGLPFGTTPAPAEYTTVSEAVIDLGNDLLRDEYWYTDDLNSPDQSLLTQGYKQQSTINISTADSLALDIISTESSTDGFIDDIITIGLVLVL